MQHERKWLSGMPGTLVVEFASGYLRRPAVVDIDSGTVQSGFPATIVGTFGEVVRRQFEVSGHHYAVRVSGDGGYEVCVDDITAHEKQLAAA